jgi:hypothetical protein
MKGEKNCKSHELGVVEVYKDQDKQEVLTILKLLPNASEGLYREGTSYIYAWEEKKW